MPAALSTARRRRLRQIWRSAGWPCQDMLEVELLHAGLLERQRDAEGRATLRVTESGIALLAQTLQKDRAARAAHETLVERVAQQMQRAGRIVWRGLRLRAGEGWAMAMPDVYSIRHTTVEAYLEPIVHEIKVRRADLLSDLRHQAKRAAYLAASGECWYVIR
jgi:predicted NBD/HSP70 family sugar kinase